MFKVRSRAKQSNAKRKDRLDADSEIIQETQVNLPFLPLFYHLEHCFKTD